MSTQQESSSALGKEVEINPSPHPNKILPNGEPQENRHVCIHVRTDSNKCGPICESACTRESGMDGPYVFPDGKGKHTEKATPEPSWADVARRGHTSDIKGISNPQSFYKI
jgi:hypothetical protein